MPDTNDRVMAMIEKEIAANPDISNEDLRAKAEKVDDTVTRMSARQFNARYPLQVKRRMRPRRSGGRKGAKRGRKAAKGAANAGAKKRGRPAGSGKRGRPAKGAARGRAAAVAGGASIRAGRGRGGGSDPRGRVRAALLDFARDLASADGAGLVDVIAGVDGYVDRVMKATGAR